MKFVIRNGEIIQNPPLTNDCVYLSEGVVAREAFWFANGNIPFFRLHIQRLEELLVLFNRVWPSDLPPENEIKRLFLRLINKNRAFMGGWVISSFHFSPLRNSFSAEVVTSPKRIFPLEQEGRNGFFSRFIKFSQNPLSRFPLASDPLFNAEALNLPDSERGSPLFLNEKGFIADSDGAAVFGISKNLLLTPAPSTGCIMIIYRNHLLRAAAQAGFRIGETERLTPAKLMECEEIFTLSEEKGFRWIAAIEDKRFVRTKTMLIWKQFNQSTFPEQ